VAALIAATCTAASVGCRDVGAPHDETRDEGDTDADSDADTDTDSDADADADADTGEDTDDGTDDGIDLGCFALPWDANTGTCTHILDWDDVPEYQPDPPYSDLCKECVGVGVIAYVNDDEPLELLYSPDCADESPVDGVFAWRWVGIDATFPELDDFDLDQCTDLELCPEACARSWDGTWSSVSLAIRCGTLMIGGYC